MTTDEVPTPFKALLAGWSLIVVVLSVAGYSFRWNYYYNFGLPEPCPLRALWRACPRTQSRSPETAHF